MALCDADAPAIAASVYRACADEFAGYELWHGPRRLHGAHALELDEVVARNQESILDLEDRLQHAFACIKRSRRLLGASARLRGRPEAGMAGHAASQGR